MVVQPNKKNGRFSILEIIRDDLSLEKSHLPKTIIYEKVNIPYYICLRQEPCF